MDRDRNLLFGILAVQLKGVPSAQMVEAAAAWATDPSIPLSQRLVDSGLLKPEDREALEQLVEEAVQAHGGDAQETLRSFGGEEQVRRTLYDEMSPEELDRMHTEPMASMAFFSRGGTIVSGVEESPGRYTVISQHARGGMGRVLLVHDEYLGRSIALKELLPLNAPADTSQKPSPMRQTASVVARFLQEARITGQLEHPSIVPVYELGRRHDGTLYYTMKLVKGKTLSQALRDCRSLQERLALLPNFVDLCQAIAYAHNRGVIHRDIKPGNVMVGQFGETVVLDWGLAKVRNSDDVNMEDIETTLQFLQLEEHEPLPKTVFGKALGTPHYMPPEQAEGRVDDIDERSDVYSLGAVLYEILTGTTPYAGKNTKEILDKVIGSRPAAILEIAPDAPPQLAGICEAALRRDREDRYQTAMELADDVQRFVTGSLVRAYRYSVREVLLHYYRKHRALVHTAAVFLLALLAVGAYSYFSILHARDREYAQRVLAERARESETEARSEAQRTGYLSQLALIQEYLRARDFSLAQKTAEDVAAALRGWEWGYLLNRTHPALMTVETPFTSIAAATVGPDGILVATSSPDGSIRIWDLETGTLKTTCEGKGSCPSVPCQFSPDGTRLVGAGQDPAVRVWAVGSGRLLHTLTNGPARALDAQFSPDGMQIASTTDDGMLHLWDAMSGKLLRESETGLSKESAVRFSPDGNFIATAAGTPQQSFGFEGQVKIWSRSDLSALFECPGADAVFNNDGKWVATFVRSEISLRELPSGTSLKRLDAAGPVRQIRISRDSRRILAASLDGNARLLDAASGAVLAVFGHGAPLEDAAFARDESVVVTCAANNTFMAWDAKSGSSLNQLAGRGTTLFTTDFSPDGSRMVTATGDGEFFQVWDPLYQVGRKLLAYGARDYPDFSICEGGGQAALFGYRGLTVFPLDGSGKPVIYAVNPLSRVYRVSVDFSPDGTRMAATLDSNTPSIWKHQSGDFVQLSGHRGPVSKIAFDKSGEKVVTASWDRTARIWDAVTGQSSIVFEGHTGGVNAAAFSPDGSRLITASNDATARIWDAQSGQCLHILEGHNGVVSCAMFNRDGHRAYTASADRTVRVWDSASGRQVGVFQGHGDQVYEITLAAEGTSYLLSSSRDGTSRIWNAATGESLLVLPEVWRARFLSAGPALAVVRRDGRFERWESAPWQRLNPSGTESFDESFAQYRAEDYAEARKTFIPDRGPAQIIMVASDRTLAESLKLLAGALQNEADDTGSLTPPPGLKLDPGPRSATLHALGFEENDTLLQLDGEDLSAGNQAVGLLNEIFSRVESQPSTSIEMLIERQGERVPVRLLTRPRVESSAKVTLNRGESAGLTREILSALMFDRASGITSDAALKAYAQIGAGFRLQMHDEWTSLWLKAGLAPEDRLIKVDGEGITDCDDALARLNRLSADVAGQKVNAFSLDLQRGDFATIHVDYSIQ